MSRAPSPTDFVVTVDGIGTFTFAKKSFRDQLAISAEFARLTEALPIVPDYLAMVASPMAALRVLTVVAPNDWDIDALDPEDSESYTKLMKVWGALRDKQASFRRVAAPRSEETGQGPLKDD